MASGNPLKKVMPGPGTREQGMAVLRKDLAEHAAWFQERALKAKEDILIEIGASDPWRSAFSASCAYNFSLEPSAEKILDGNAIGWSELQRTFSYMKWGIDLVAHDYDRDSHDYSRGTLMDHEVTFYFLLAQAAGLSELANPAARMLYKSLIEDGYKTIWDSSSPLADVLYRLVVADLKGEWDDPLDKEWGGGELGGFQRLLVNLGTTDFKDALIEYCDFRMARSLGYASLDALRPSPPNREASFEFENFAFALFPLELLALKAIYERTTGQILSLDSDHPLLRVPLMNIPKSFTLIEDDITISMQGLGKKVFGSDWKPGWAPHLG